MSVSNELFTIKERCTLLNIGAGNIFSIALKDILGTKLPARVTNLV